RVAAAIQVTPRAPSPISFHRVTSAATYSMLVVIGGGRDGLQTHAQDSQAAIQLAFAKIASEHFRRLHV
ncbi:hypothetical protein, partial [Mesorhizobium jarvisii]|uniref:hypothetical protein n=1 Tax=Mesorhizobium jarvisii TaxID=1777867 RepID=UPI001FE04B40